MILLIYREGFRQEERGGADTRRRVTRPVTVDRYAARPKDAVDDDRAARAAKESINGTIIEVLFLLC